MSLTKFFILCFLTLSISCKNKSATEDDNSSETNAMGCGNGNESKDICADFQNCKWCPNGTSASSSNCVKKSATCK